MQAPSYNWQVPPLQLVSSPLQLTSSLLHLATTGLNYSVRAFSFCLCLHQGKASQYYLWAHKVPSLPDMVGNMPSRATPCAFDVAAAHIGAQRRQQQPASPNRGSGVSPCYLQVQTPIHVKLLVVSVGSLSPTRKKLGKEWRRTSSAVVSRRPGHMALPP